MKHGNFLRFETAISRILSDDMIQCAVELTCCKFGTCPSCGHTGLCGTFGNYMVYHCFVVTTCYYTCMCAYVSCCGSGCVWTQSDCKIFQGVGDHRGSIALTSGLQFHIGSVNSYVKRTYVIHCTRFQDMTVCDTSRFCASVGRNAMVDTQFVHYKLIVGHVFLCHVIEHTVKTSFCP